jgi:alcohol dehydrogenase
MEGNLDAVGLGKTFPFQLPTRIEFGSGVAERLGEEAAAFGRRALLITDRGVREAGIVEPLEARLAQAGVEYDVFTDVESNPRTTIADNAAAHARDSGADLLIAVGGGSVIDTAKAASAVASYGGTILDYEGADQIPGPAIPVLVVPTTSGTGSEVTLWAVLTDEARKYEMAVGSAHIAARVALIDPSLTTSLPEEVTLSAGLDALCNAAEAYTARCSNPLSDALALYAIELFAMSLERALDDGADLDARCGMAMASLAAGIAFGNADTAAAHSMGEALSGVYDAAHGLACAVCLPYVMGLNLPAVPEKTARIGQALGLQMAWLSPLEAGEATIEAVFALRKRLKVPSLGALGATEADVPLLVGVALMNLGNPDNPVDVDETVFTQLFLSALGEA